MEREVLGILLLPSANGSRNACGLRPADFVSPSHGVIFAAIQELVEAGKPVDSRTVVHHLRETGRIAEVKGDDAEGSGYVHLLAEARIPPNYLPHYAGIVRDLAHRRAEIRIARDLEAGDLDREAAMAALADLGDAAREQEQGDGPSVPVFYGLDDLRDLTEPDVEWYVERVLGKGLFTMLGAKAKAGKRTMIFGMLRAMMDGASFLGFGAHRTRVLYVTEQSRQQIRKKAEEYDLLDHLAAGDLIFMFPRMKMAVDWEGVIAEAATYCQANGINVLIVDTVNDLCRLQDTNSDTEWIQALDPLQKLCHRDDMAVLASMHATKVPAALIDMFRGSSAIVAKGDIIWGLWREGTGAETIRMVESISRDDNAFEERTRIVRDGLVYLTAGTAKELEVAAKHAELLAALPASQEAALSVAALAKELNVPGTTLREYLRRLEAEGRIGTLTLPGRGGPQGYWALPSEDNE